MEVTKLCSKCGRVLPISEFYPRVNGKGVQSWCKDCCRSHGRLRNGTTGVYRMINQNEESMELEKNDEIVSSVFKTTDYNKFVKIAANREVDHVSHIKKSMEGRFVPSPIVVNEKMEVIDGQNRLEASKELGLPVYYCVFEGLGIEDVRAMNQASKNWNKKDYIDSYASEGKEDYVLFQKFKDLYPDFTTSVDEFLLRLALTNDRFSDGRHRLAYDAVKRGSFQIKDFQRSCEVADMVMAYKGLDNNRHPIYKRKEFACAIIKLARLPEFDNEEVIRKIKQYPRSFVPCRNTEDYIRMIEEIVNYRRRTNKIRFNV